MGLNLVFIIYSFLLINFYKKIVGLKFEERFKLMKEIN